MTVLRPARPTDAGKIGAILSEFVDTTPWIPRIHSRAEDLAHAGVMIDRGWVTVAETSGQIAGFAALNGAELNALYVSEQAQGSGIGSALLTHLKTVQPRLDLWTFQANTRAQAFYLRHGFTEIERTAGAGNDEKLPDIRLEWQKEAA
ncbi:MAG: GNAT family N-acetyltransferase [Sulfitobacter sp.]